MTWFRCGGSGIPAALKSQMNDVLNKKFGTSIDYPPEGWPDDVNLLGPLPEKTVAGAIAHTDDAADTVPVKSVICSIVPKQAGSGTPSPTNVRALSGYTGLKMWQTGKNFLNPVLYDGGGYNPSEGSQRTFTESATQFTRVGNTFSVSFTEAWKTYTMLVPVKYGQVYYCSFTLSGTGTNLGTSVYYVDADNKVIASASNNTSNPQTRTFAMNVPSGAKYFCITFTNRGTSETTLTFTEPQVEVGSSASSFEAYNAAADISDSWSSIGAIYGGERDLTKGTLKETFEIFTFDGSQDENWGIFTVNTNQTLFRIYDTPRKSGTLSGSSGIPSFCNMFEKAPNESSGRTDGKYSGTGTNIDFIYNSAVDLTAWRSFLSNNPIQIVIEKDSATTYSSLQTYDFETLYAVNNFYSDIEGGQTQLTYRQDIALALQAVSGTRNLLMMASRPVAQMVGEESDLDQVNELVEDNETEQEDENDAR